MNGGLDPAAVAAAKTHGMDHEAKIAALGSAPPRDALRIAARGRIVYRQGLALT
jgi:hypothetical protein